MNGGPTDGGGRTPEGGRPSDADRTPVERPPRGEGGPDRRTNRRTNRRAHRLVGAAGDVFALWAQRSMPDPFVLALLLTGVAFVAALALTPSTPTALVGYWASGLWGFLSFAMQMALVLVTGHAIASAPPVLRGLRRLAALPRSGPGAVALTAAVAGLAGLVNWGLGLIAGAVLAREAGRQAEARGVAAHYPLLGAAGYVGMLVWHGGLSGSAPLIMATAVRDVVPEAGVVPISDTLFSTLNVVTSAAVLAVAVGVLWLMAPREPGRARSISGWLPPGDGDEGGAPPASATGEGAGRTAATGEGAGPTTSAGEGAGRTTAPSGGAGRLATAAGLFAAAAVVFWAVRASRLAGRPVEWAVVAVDAATLAFVGRHLLLRLRSGLGRWPSRAGAAVAALAAGGALAFGLRAVLGGLPALGVAAGAVVAVYAGYVRLSAPHRPAVPPAEELEGGPAFALLAGLAGLGYLQVRFAQSGFSLDLNLVILAFLSVGLLLRASPADYLAAVSEATPGAAGIVLQFPFYAGILGLMKASGLLAVVAGGMIAAADATLFPVLAFLSAGLVNVFVPSGGGQWAVQGPLVLEAGAALGVPAAKSIMAVAFGDEWTNMLQPFWALPLLGITGLAARDVIGYTLMVLLATGAVFVSALLLL